MEFDDDDDEEFLKALAEIEIPERSSNGFNGGWVNQHHAAGSKPNQGAFLGATVGVSNGNTGGRSLPGSNDARRIGGQVSYTPAGTDEQPRQLHRQTKETPRMEQTLLAPFKGPLRNPPPDHTKPTRQVSLHNFGITGNPAQTVQGRGSYRAVAEATASLGDTGGPRRTFGETGAAPPMKSNTMVGGDSGRGSAPTYVVPQSLPKPPDIRPHQHDPDEVLTWIYPTNLPVRAYQLDIVRRSLFQNTLVSLPTGLGKTFIAAVVLSNHLRWFPKSRAVFMVPTKPLVAQQMESVWRSVGMPVSWTVDMTGQMSPPQRALAWRAKRLVFCTPQTFENDLKSSTAPAESFSLLVFDEAHRATGNYSYCEIIKLLYRRNPQFRVLALSATPGSSQQAVQSVITNLLISAAEIRSEAHPDVAPYVQDRKKEIIVTKEDEIVAAVKGLLVKLLDPIIARLTRNKAFHTRSSESVAPAALLQHRDKTWRPQVKPTLPTAQAHAIEADFGNAISLSHALQNLLQFGVGTCRADLLRWQEETNNSDKYVTKARRDLVNSADFTQLIDNLNSLVAQPGFMGHPKLTKVSQIVREHFTTCGQDSKVIIFSTIRSSVDEIVRSLEDQQPTVRVSVFIGQSGSSGKRDSRGQSAGRAPTSNARKSKGMTQNEQMKVLEKFQAGDYNVLVATCIGEEGLDIGEVDLIINYDSQSSPIRMTQRIGRTGRKREGRVVMLLQEGKEERAYRDSETRYRNVQRAIENAKFTFFPPNQLLPDGINGGVGPTLVKKQVEISKEESVAADVAAKRSSTSTGRNSGRSNVPSKAFLSKDELLEYQRHYAVRGSKHFAWVPDPLASLHLQSRPTETYLLKHGVRCRGFIDLVGRIQGLAEEESEERGLCIPFRKAGSFPRMLERHLEMGDCMIGMDAPSWGSRMSGQVSRRKWDIAFSEGSDDEDFRSDGRKHQENNHSESKKRKLIRREPRDVELRSPERHPVDLELGFDLEMDFELAPPCEPVKFIEEEGNDPLASMFSQPESHGGAKTFSSKKPPGPIRFLELEDSDSDLETPSQILGSSKRNVHHSGILHGATAEREPLDNPPTNIAQVNTVGGQSGDKSPLKLSGDGVPSVEEGGGLANPASQPPLRRSVDRTPPLVVRSQSSNSSTQDYFRRLLESLPRRPQNVLDSEDVARGSAPTPLLRMARRRRERVQRMAPANALCPSQTIHTLKDEDYIVSPPGRILRRYLEDLRENNRNVVSGAISSKDKSTPAVQLHQELEVENAPPTSLERMHKGRNANDGVPPPQNNSGTFLSRSETDHIGKSCPAFEGVMQPCSPNAGLPNRDGQIASNPRPLLGFASSEPNVSPILRANRPRKLKRPKPTNTPPSVDDPITKDTAGRKRLVRLGDMKVPDDKSVDTEGMDITTRKKRREKLPMYTNSIFDVEAEESEGSQASTDDEDGADLDQNLPGFVVSDDVTDTQAIITSELDDEEEEDGRVGRHIPMSDFYRQSLLTPNLARHHGVASEVHKRFETLPNQLGGLNGKFRLAWSLKTPETPEADDRGYSRNTSRTSSCELHAEASSEVNLDDDYYGAKSPVSRVNPEAKAKVAHSSTKNFVPQEKYSSLEEERFVPATPPQPERIAHNLNGSGMDLQIDELLAGVDFSDIPDSQE